MSIAVVIPTYNRSAHVRCAIDSALAQTVVCDEIIVVDDGSTDATPGVLDSYAGKIRWLRQDNRGAAAARNAGIQAAQSEWVVFLDSDDELEPIRLEVLIRDLSRWPDIVAHCGNALFCTEDRVQHDHLSLRGLHAGDASHYVARPLALHLGMQFLTPTFAVRRDVLLEEGGFPARLRIFEDYHLMTRVALHGPWVWAERSLARVFRRGPAASNIFLNIPDKALQVGLSLEETYLTLLDRNDLVGEERRLVGRRLSSTLADIADHYRSRGHVGGAMAHYARSLQACLTIQTLGRALVGCTVGRRALARLRPRP